MPMPWSRTTNAIAVVDDARADLDRLVRARVLDRVVEQVHDRAAHLAGVAEDLDVGRLRSDDAAARRPRRPPPARGRRTPRAAAAPASAPRVGASWASIVLRSSRSSTIRASRSASRTTRSASRCTTADVVGRGHRLGEQTERADRRLQLVTHVGDEVAPHALDPARLGDVARERDRADDLAVAAQRERAQLQHLAGRAVELELALGAVPGERLLHELGDRLLGEDLAGARAGEAPRHRVAHDLAADAVDDDDRVARLVERGEQPVLHRLRLQHPVVGLALALRRSRRPATDSSGTSTARRTRPARAGRRPTRARRTRRRPTRPDRRRRRSAVTIAAGRAGSSESTGDVALGARVGGVREDAGRWRRTRRAGRRGDRARRPRRS